MRLNIAPGWARPVTATQSKKERTMSFSQSLRWRKVLLVATAVPLLAVAVVAASLPTAGVAPGKEAKSPATSMAKAMSAAFRDAAKEVQPTVVMIKNEGPLPVKLEGRTPRDDEGSAEGGSGERFPGMPDLGKFFHEMPRQPRHSPGGMGSGLIIDSSGVILTNNHVVEGGGEITVRLYDGREFRATKVTTDPKTDLAVLRIEGAKHLQAAKLGDSDAAEVGDWVIALGHPFGLEGTVTAGIVSAKGRGIGLTERGSFIQTDAAINPGNSGGPLVNLDGEVIGINTAIVSNGGGNEGIGFAIPINSAKWVATQLTKDGLVHRARLGVMIQPLTDELARHFGVKAREGVLVAGVTPGSPAAKAGLQAGDVIVTFAGKAVSTPQELQGSVEQAAIGRQQSLAIVRDGKPRTLNVAPTEQPEDPQTAATGADGDHRPDSRLEKLGLEVQPLTSDLAKQLEIQVEQGVVIANVRPNSLAERCGLRAGSVIVEAHRKPVKTVDDLAKAMDEKSLANGVLLLVPAPKAATTSCFADDADNPSTRRLVNHEPVFVAVETSGVVLRETASRTRYRRHPEVLFALQCKRVEDIRRKELPSCRTPIPPTRYRTIMPRRGYPVRKPRRYATRPRWPRLARKCQLIAIRASS